MVPRELEMAMNQMYAKNLVNVPAQEDFTKVVEVLLYVRLPVVAVKLVVPGRLSGNLQRRMQ